MICLVVALNCEAKPLIAHYGLKPANHVQGFRVFQNQDTALIVSGPGRTAAAAATAYLQGSLGAGRHRTWVNVGIGGHRDHKAGDLFLAHKITDAATDQSWYPPVVIAPPCETAAVRTVDVPELNYRQDGIYEMEAAGFYPIACRFSTAELVQSVKVISDNPESPADRLTAKQVEQLIAAQLPAILSIIHQTERLGRELAALEQAPRHYQTLLQRWRFTESERHLLRQLLQRYQLLYPDDDGWPDRNFSRGKDVLRWLENRIRACPVRIA